MGFQFNQTACRSGHRLSKATLKAMLGPPPDFGQPYSSNPSRAFFEKIEEEWEITSFNPNTRTVCATIYANDGDRTVSVILPVLSVSKPFLDF